MPNKEKIVDDVFGNEEDDQVEEDKLALLKSKMNKRIKSRSSQPKEIEKTVIKRSIDLGIIGSGQCGSRLSAYMYSLGYNAVAINTASHDLEHIQIPEDNKFLMEFGLGGASRDRSIGHEAAQRYKEDLFNFVNDKLDDCQMFVFCTSLGGGSGSGSIETVIEVLSAIDKPIVVITVLPMTNEDSKSKMNALEALSLLSQKVRDKEINNLIVVDNAKIESIFSDVSQMDFYDISNKAIIDPLDVFNTFSAKASSNVPLDGMEFLKILIDGEGLSLYGCMTVEDYEEDTAIAEAIISNLDEGLLANGFDLKQTRYVGVMVLANKNVWSRIPSSSINYAMSMVQDAAGTPEGVFKGIYETDMDEDVVKVYSFFSGLALPDPRIKELKAEVAAQKELIKSKTVKRNLSLSLDAGETETVSAVEKIKKKIAQKSSTFGKFTQNIVDKRKK